MAYLIQLPDNSQMIVDSLDGHDDCTVLDDNSPATSLADMRLMKRSEVNLYLAGQFLGGFTAPAGPLSGHTLQVRDETDRTNWLTSQAAYSAMVAAGNGTALGASFRTVANETVTVSYLEGFQALLMMADWGKSLMGKSWTLKDAIDALPDADAIEAFDIAAEWAAL
jgi:hypothetical protein